MNPSRHEYGAEVLWQRAAHEAFTDNRYSRKHRLRFDGGTEVPGSASPSVVPLPMSDAAAVDPEEAFVASLAACHMLWFLSIAAGAGYVVDQYRDAADRRDDQERTGQAVDVDASRCAPRCALPARASRTRTSSCDCTTARTTPVSSPTR